MAAVTMTLALILFTISAKTVSASRPAHHAALSLEQLGPAATPPPKLRARQHRNLKKRAEWVAVCEGGETDCPVIGISDVVTAGDGQHYVPMCAYDSDAKTETCQYIGYVDPTSGIAGSTTYEIAPAQSTGLPVVIPIIVPPFGEGPPVGVPPEEIDPPAPEESLPPITSATLTSCSRTSAPATTITAEVSMNDQNLESAALYWVPDIWTWNPDYMWLCPGTESCHDRPTATSSVSATTSSTEAPVTTSDPATTTAAPSPYATGTCHIQLEVDQWSGDADHLSPFFVDVLSMTDDAGTSLNGAENFEWTACGAVEPCEVPSLLGETMYLRPILAPLSHGPYVQLTLGDVVISWSSRDDLANKHMPGCSSTITDDSGNPKKNMIDCDFPCGIPTPSAVDPFGPTPSDSKSAAIMIYGGSDDHGSSVKAAMFDVTGMDFDYQTNPFCGMKQIDGFEYYNAGTTRLGAAWSSGPFDFNSDIKNCQYTDTDGSKETLVCDGLPEGTVWKCDYHGSGIPDCTLPAGMQFQLYSICKVVEG